MQPFEGVTRKTKPGAVPASCRIRPHSNVHGASAGPSTSPFPQQRIDTAGVRIRPVAMGTRQTTSVPQSVSDSSKHVAVVNPKPVKVTENHSSSTRHVSPPRIVAQPGSPATSPLAMSKLRSPTRQHASPHRLGPNRPVTIVPETAARDDAALRSTVMVRGAPMRTEYADDEAIRALIAGAISPRELLESHAGNNGRTSPSRGSPALQHQETSFSIGSAALPRALTDVSVTDVSFTMETAKGIRVADYITTFTDLRKAVEQSDMKWPQARPLVESLIIPPGTSGRMVYSVAEWLDEESRPGAIGFEVDEPDDSFFTAVPVLAPNGSLHLNMGGTTGRVGRTQLRYRAVDYSEVDTETHQFRCSDWVTLPVEFQGVPIARRKLVADLSRSAISEAPVSPDTSPSKKAALELKTSGMATSPGLNTSMGAPAPSGTGSLAGTFALRPMNLHSFRRASPFLTASIITRSFVKHQPLFLLKMCTWSAELELLRRSNANPEDADQLLEQIKSAMDLRSSIDTILPLIDKACRLHFSIGGSNGLQTAQKLSALRMQLLSAALGIDASATTDIEAAVAQRLSSVKHTTVQVYIRVLVEGAHLAKHMGKLEEALALYRLATSVATIGNRQVHSGANKDSDVASPLGGSPSPTPGLGGSRRAVSLVPFVSATGDTLMMMGRFSDALEHYEKARAMAEAAGGGSILAECEDDVALALASQEQFEEADQALQRSLRLRNTIGHDVSTAETYLYLAACHAMRDAKDRAEQAAEKAVDLLQTTQRPTRLTSPVDRGPQILSGAASPTGADPAAPQLLLASAMMMHGWLQMDRTVNSEVKQTLQQAVSICARTSGDHSWEVVLPTWLAESYDEVDSSRLETLLSVLTHHVGAGNPLSCGLALAASLHHVPKQRSSAWASRQSNEQLLRTMCSGEVAEADEIQGEVKAAYEQAWRLSDTAMSTLMQLPPGHAIQLLGIETEAIIALRFGRFSQAREALVRYFHSWTMAYHRTKHNASLAFRVAPLAAQACTGVPEQDRVTTARVIVDAIDEFVANRSAEHGEFNAVMVPLLTDLAEIHCCRESYDLALEFLGRAIRIADTRNLLYLLGALFKPNQQLTANERTDRDRLLRERHPGDSGMTELAKLLLAVAAVHELSNDAAQGHAAYQQAYAAFEMGNLLDEPATVEALLGVARTQAVQGALGDCLSATASARELFMDHHYAFGAYREDPLLTQLWVALEHAEKAGTDAIQERNYILVPHVHHNPAAPSNILL